MRRETMADNRMRLFHPIAHISACAAGDRCGYSALVSLSPQKRTILFGCVDRSESKATLICAELHAVRDVIKCLAENNIQNATIKVDMPKVIDALTGNDDIDGCLMLVREIIVLATGKEISYTTEETNKDSLTYEMARRAVGAFSYKNDYKWRPECGKYISGLYEFCIKEFYSRKIHEDWEYIHLAYMRNQYHGITRYIPLPLGAKKTIDFWSHDKEKQDVAAMYYLCGMTTYTACRCAAIALEYPDDEKLFEQLRTKIRVLAMQRNHKNRTTKLNDQDIALVTGRVAYGYYQGNYPLRSLSEAVLDEYLTVLAENEDVQKEQNTDIPKKKQIYVAGVGEPKKQPKNRCAVCGAETADICTCSDMDIVNILRRKKIRNMFCSAKCFAKAAGLINHVKQAG